MKFKKISLTDKFVILFIALGVVAAGVVSGMAYYLAKDALMSRTFDQLTSVKSVKKKQLENYFQDRQRDLIYLRNLLQLEDASECSPEPQNIISDLHLKYLNDFVGLNIFIDNFYLIAEDGQVYSSADSSKISAGGIAYLQTLAFIDSIFVMDIDKQAPDNKFHILIGTPVYKNNRKFGILALDLNLGPVNSIMLEQNPGTGLGESGESYLVGSDFLMRSNSRFQQNAIMNVSVKTQGVKKALAGFSETAVFPDYRGVEVLSSYCKLDIKGLNWVLLAEIDLKEALDPVDDIRNYIIFLTVSISLVVFVIAFIISVRMSRPLKNLTRASERVGSGDFDVEVEIESNDEIGDLTSAFNLMSSRLKDQSQELENERLKRYSIATDAEEKERERLSRELHDGIGQSFIAIKLKLEQLFDGGPGENEKSLEEIEKAFDDAIDEIRRMSNNLSPSVLKAFGLENAIRNLCNNVQEYARCSIDLEYNFDREIINKKTEIYLYRIVQEAMNNIRKHSSARHVEIKIFELSGKFNMLISDNGKGFDPEGESSGRGAGLFNMKQRAEILGGSVEIESENNKGVKVLVQVPLESVTNSNEE